MSDEAFLFSTTAEALMDLPVGEALKEGKKPECVSYAEVFLKRAAAAETAGDDGVARAWGLLAHLCRVALRPSEPNEPFRPMREEPGGRTMVPGDMDEESAAAVRELGFAATDGELGARLVPLPMHSTSGACRPYRARRQWHLPTGQGPCRRCARRSGCGR